MLLPATSLLFGFVWFLLTFFLTHVSIYAYLFFYKCGKSEDLLQCGGHYLGFVGHLLVIGMGKPGVGGLSKFPDLILKGKAEKSKNKSLL